MLPLRRPAQKRSVNSVTMPAPTGGINTVDAGTAMPANDLIYGYNLIAGEFGLRSRLGYREWVTNLGFGTLTQWSPSTSQAIGSAVFNGGNLYVATQAGTTAGTGATGPAGTGIGISDGSVVWNYVGPSGASAGNLTTIRTVLPFAGSRKNGASDRLFAATIDGIYDVSSSTQVPIRVVTFPTQSTDSGWGICQVVSTPAGHFLVYTDEENGLYIYSELTTLWIRPVQAATVAWIVATAYAVGQYVASGGVTYICATAGTSAAAPATGPSGQGTGIVDGTITWNYAPAIGGVNPANLAFCLVWQNRVWLIEKDTTRAWYLGFFSILGTAVAFDFGIQLKAGGPLAGLFNWTVDGGSGVQDSLVAISTGGDVAVYQGTNPALLSTFAIKGVWSVGAVPYGRRIATDFGGDLLILSSLGIMPLSRLIVGNTVFDRSQYLTNKISNLFNNLVNAYGTLQGWSIRLHPSDNALLVLIPQAAGQPTIQLAMSFATKGWFQYRALPMLCAETFGGQLYFGTTDGRVCVNTDFLDNVQLTNPQAYTPVEFSMLTSFQSISPDGVPDGRKKRVQMIRPTFLSKGAAVNYQATAKFDFNLDEPNPAPVIPSGAAGPAGTWDVATWDDSLWAGEYQPQQQPTGAFGMGNNVAIAIRGTTTARMSLVGIDIMYDEGGLL